MPFRVAQEMLAAPVGQLCSSSSSRSTSWEPSLPAGRGYNMGGDVVVRCREGHLFTTIWVPGASFKALRLPGWARWQRCPVGGHWTFVTPVREAELTEDERREAHQFHDVRIP